MQAGYPAWEHSSSTWSRSLTRAQAWPVGGPGEGSGALQGTALSLSLGAPTHLPVLRLEGLEDPGEKAVIHLSPHSLLPGPLRG